MRVVRAGGDPSVESFPTSDKCAPLHPAVSSVRAPRARAERSGSRPLPEFGHVLARVVDLLHVRLCGRGN